MVEGSVLALDELSAAGKVPDSGAMSDVRSELPSGEEMVGTTGAASGLATAAGSELAWAVGSATL